MCGREYVDSQQRTLCVVILYQNRNNSSSIKARRACIRKGSSRVFYSPGWAIALTNVQHTPVVDNYVTQPVGSLCFVTVEKAVAYIYESNRSCGFRSKLLRPRTVLGVINEPMEINDVYEKYKNVKQLSG